VAEPRFGYVVNWLYNFFGIQAKILQK
jgi:hypothetical protein